MNGLDLLTPPQHYSRANGRRLTPGKGITLSGIHVRFEDGIEGAHATAEIQRRGDNDVRCTVHVFVGDNKLATSIQNVCNATEGTAWVRVKAKRPRTMFSSDMEVHVGSQIPELESGFETLARIKIKDTEGKATESDSDEEVVEFQIFVRLFNGQSTTYTVQPETTVKNLKLMTQKRTQIPPDQQRLLYGGCQLEDHRTLTSYDIGPNASINMVSRLRGG